jgi:hypothetical protein
MKDFDLRWKQCCVRAQETRGRDESAPFGFAGRVVALGSERLTTPAPLEVVWQQLTMRSLGLVGAILVVCAVVELPHLRDRKPLDPGIENTVAQLVWTL